MDCIINHSVHQRSKINIRCAEQYSVPYTDPWEYTLRNVKIVFPKSILKDWVEPSFSQKPFKTIISIFLKTILNCSSWQCYLLKITSISNFVILYEAECAFIVPDLCHSDINIYISIYLLVYIYITHICMHKDKENSCMCLCLIYEIFDDWYWESGRHFIF